MYRLYQICLDFREQIQQLLNGWEDAFDVEPNGKLATTWGRMKATR